MSNPISNLPPTKETPGFLQRFVDNREGNGERLFKPGSFVSSCYTTQIVALGKDAAFQAIIVDVLSSIIKIIGAATTPVLWPVGNDGFVKSSAGKARVVRQAHHDGYGACPEPAEGKDEAQRGIRAFYEAVRNEW